MPNKIKPRRSYTANSVPLVADLEENEMAVNWTDGKIFVRQNNAIITLTLGGSGGSGGSLSGSVTVPGLGDPYFSNVALLLHMDGTGATFTDSSGTPKTITAYGNATQSDTSKFGGKSAYFDGDGDYLSIPSGDDFAIGTGDFTVEAWVYWDANPAGQHATIASKGNRESSSQWSWLIAAEGGTDQLSFRTGGQNIAMTSAGVPRNTWTHVAITRSGSMVRCFINGALSGSGTLSDSLTNSETLLVGRNPTTDYYAHFKGYIDDFRLSKGVARYTAAFTPPAAALHDASSLTLPVTITGSGGGGSGLTWSSVPVSATATGTAGSIAYDGSYFYLAPQSNTWVRVALSTWSSFTPASVTGLQLWLDGSDASTLYDATSGGSLVAADGAVARWEDKSGNARHFTQSSSGSRPLRKTSQQNGKDTLLFDGTNDFMAGSDFLDADTGGLTAFIVFKRNAAGEVHELLTKFDTNGKGWGVRHLDNNKWSAVIDTASGSSSRATSSVIDSAAYNVMTWMFSAGAFTSLSFWRNAASQSMAFASGNVNTPDNTSGIVKVGAQEYQGTHYYHANANFAEVILYNAALSDTDRAAVESYLMTKWAIT